MGTSAIFRRPVVTNGEAKFVGFAGGFAVQSEFADACRRAADVPFLHPRVCDNQTAVVQNVMANQFVDELRNISAKLRVFGFKLFQCLGQAVRDLHILSVQFPHQFCVVISGYTQRITSADHSHDKPKHLDDLGAAINQIADKDHLATRRRNDAGMLGRVVSKLFEQLDQLVKTAMNIADDIKRPLVRFSIVPKRLSFDHDLIHFVRRVQNMHIPKAFTFHAATTSPQLHCLIADDMRAKAAIRPGLIPLLTDIFRNR